MMTHLKTPIVLQTPKGKALAVAALAGKAPQWLAFVPATGECCLFDRSETRLLDDEPRPQDDAPPMVLVLVEHLPAAGQKPRPRAVPWDRHGMWM